MTTTPDAQEDNEPIDKRAPVAMSVGDIGDATVCTRRMMFDTEFLPLADHAMQQFQQAALKTRYGRRLVSSSTNAVIRVLCLTVILDLLGKNYLNPAGETWVMRLIGKEHIDAERRLE